MLYLAYYLMKEGKIMAEKISNEQIAHDLAVAYIAKSWHNNEFREEYSVSVYLEKYEEFLNELNRSNY